MEMALQSETSEKVRAEWLQFQRGHTNSDRCEQIENEDFLIKLFL